MIGFLKSGLGKRPQPLKRMQLLTISITPLSAFGTVPRGDQIFGQLCAHIAQSDGQERLRELLAGYTEGRPFLVCSDFFPAGYLPRPTLPPDMYQTQPQNRQSSKQLKRAVWLPKDCFHEGIEVWRERLKNAEEILPREKDIARKFNAIRGQSHNSIQRDSGTTGKGQFAPYTIERIWYAPGAKLECHLVYDDSYGLQPAMIRQWFAAMGVYGFGRDATIGMGKFAVEPASSDITLPAHGSAFLTLAPIAPQGQNWKSEYCFYKCFTRFGRHGKGAGGGQNPFKVPLLLLDTGAVLVPQIIGAELPKFLGQGLGGEKQPISRARPETIHQGYAPVLPMILPKIP